MIAIPAANQPTGLKFTDRTLVAMNVDVSEVKTRRYQILGFVYS